MSYRIIGDETLTVGAQALEIPVRYRNFIFMNNSTDASVYFREKGTDGIDAAADRGFALWPGEQTRFPLTADQLSLVSDGKQADVRVLYLDG